ncbi:T9SS type A sorting domain-containing protein [Pedobacter sp. SD-b]|uniref:T9SS type A sorting domain-containing protein n=1 Tax=Pedobacter segetis TaxID=2793069 RepID=A0ABS1BNI6_9SPHI|nr:T9SS type A sorting domain-containing protein [Pedobacter segetis]MBK0384455.1 T9SS type A sorting domain-containing protein [Pedobacter segetis]
MVKVKDSVYLAGNLQLYATKYREPEKPMYISLVRKEDKKPAKKASLYQEEKLSINDVKEEKLTEFAAYPNPFNDSFTVSFNLTEQVNVTATLTDMNGRQVHQQYWKQLNAGQQKQTITVDLQPGTYVLTLANGKQVKSLILIKQ